MCTVYVLENSKKRFYVGYTSKNIKERVQEHNQGKCRWTKGKGPWCLRYSEQFSSKENAFRREQQIKKYKGGRAFKELVS